MSEREKLVKEIATYLEVLTTKPERYHYAGTAANLITLILSAVRDGRLELPGEVGRQWHLADNDMDATTGMWLRSMGLDDILLIALSGTGKEEKE